MGTKRVGLARVQALLENLKRELDLSWSLRAAPVPNYSNKIEVDAATLTIAYATHMGRPVIQKQACVFTLPAVADVQGDIWIINGAEDGTLCTISPNGSDKFVWDVAGAAGTNNKDLINTAATAKKGDYVKLRYGSGDGWSIKEMGGTWADE
tara:strand:- start:168 stop:623 length:456 start_codon:yes stop_codon:yes gene_type:complete